MPTAHFDSEQELFEAEEATPKNLMDLFFIPTVGEKILLEMDPADLYSTLRINRQFNAIVENSSALQRKMFLAQLPADETLTKYDTWSITPDTAWKPNTLLCPGSLNETQLLSFERTPRRHFVHKLFPQAVLSCEWLHAPVNPGQTTPGDFETWHKAHAKKQFTRIFVLRIKSQGSWRATHEEETFPACLPPAGEKMFLTDRPTFHFVQILDMRGQKTECQPICPGMRMIDVLELAEQVTTVSLEGKPQGAVLEHSTPTILGPQAGALAAMSNSTISNTTASSAANRVFAIPELLEAILLQLPAETKEVPCEAVPPSFEYTVKTSASSIIAVKRVSRTFNNTINDSPALQRRIKEPIPVSLSRRLLHSDGSLSVAILLKDHGMDVSRAWKQATNFITDETAGESWRNIVFLGEFSSRIQVEFFVKVGARIRLTIRPGATFDQVVRKYRRTLEKEGLASKETPEMFYARMNRIAREKGWHWAFLPSDD